MQQPVEVNMEAESQSALLNADGVAQLLGVSRRTVWRLLSAGRLPRPVVLGASGGLRKWRRKELLRWIDCSCPPADAWRSFASEQAANTS